MDVKMSPTSNYNHIMMWYSLFTPDFLSLDRLQCLDHLVAKHSQKYPNSYGRLAETMLL